MASDIAVDYDGLIPNNVGLNQDPRLRRALESWHPSYLDWWKGRGPEGFQDHLVYLRTAVSVEPEGWAKFGYVRMPDYRWGILLAPPVADRAIGFGAHQGEPAWQEVPGEYRAMLRRLSGRTHTVFTGLAVRRKSDGLRIDEGVASDVTMKVFDEATIDTYLARVHTLDKAGGYAIQEHSDLIVAGYRGSLTNIVGLPVETTKHILTRCGLLP